MSSSKRPLAPSSLFASILVLFSACGAPAPPRPAPRIAPAAAAEPPAVEAPVPDAAPAPAPTPDARFVGDWIAEGDVFTALYATIAIRDGELDVELLQGLPAHASGQPICGAAGAPDAPFDCEEETGVEARFRVELAAPELVVHLDGDGWSELGVGAQTELRLRRIGPLEAMLWGNFADAAHEAGEMGEDVSDELDPEGQIAALHGALRAAGIDPVTLDENAALVIWEASDALADRDAQCRASRCACGPSAIERLASMLTAFRSGLSWLPAIGTWSAPTAWNTYVRIDERGRLGVFAFPERLRCEGALTGPVLTLACDDHDITLDSTGGGVTVAYDGEAPVRFQRATPVELIGTRDVQALEGPARDAARSTLRVANSLRTRPRSDAGARAALDAAEAVLSAERTCRDGRTTACERAALQTLERRVARDRALRCSLLESE